VYGGFWFIPKLVCARCGATHGNGQPWHTVLCVCDGMPFEQKSRTATHGSLVCDGILVGGMSESKTRQTVARGWDVGAEHLRGPVPARVTGAFFPYRKDAEHAMF